MLTRLLAAVAWALLAAGAAGQTQSLSCIYQNYITEYRVPGEVADVELDEDLAYIIYGENADGHLRIVDVTDLDDIVTIADLELPYTPRGAKLINGRLYCYGGLIIDVTTPQSPFIFGKIDSHFGVFDTEVVGDLAYVAGNLTGLQIYDMSDPANPVELSVVPMPERAWSVDVVGQYAYVGANFDGLYVVDISDPESPVITDSIGLYGATHSVEVVDSIAYVGVGMGGLQLIDVSDPYDIEFRSVYDNTDRYGGSIQVSYADSERVYCTDDVRGIFEIDVTDPENPTRRHVIQLPRRSTGVGVSDRLVASAIQLTNSVYFFERDRLPPSPVVGNVQYLADTCSAVVSDDYVFATDCGTDISVLDVSDRSAPAPIRTIPMPFRITGLAAKGHHLFALLADFGVVAIDVSDIQQPEIVGVLRLEHQLLSMVVENDIAYVRTDGSVFWLVDLGDPADLRLEGRHAVQGEAEAVMVEDGRAYFVSNVPYSQSTVEIADVSNPGHILGMGQFELPDAGYLLAVKDRLAFVQYSHRNRWIMIVYDTSNPGGVSVASPDREFGPLTRPVFDGNVLYASGWMGSLLSYDFTDLDAPVLRGYFATGELLRPVHILDSDTLVAFGDTEGMYLLDISDRCHTCTPDTNSDGILSPADFTAWVAAFNAQGAGCDQNADGLCTPSDFTAWVANFNAGCD